MQNIQKAENQTDTTAEKQETESTTPVEATFDEVEKTSDVEVKVESKENATPVKRIKRERPELDLHQNVTVYNGGVGGLNIRLPKAGYVVRISEFGGEQEIELGELQALRNANPDFFEKNWIIIEDPEVIEFLRVEKYYKDYMSIDDMIAFFELDVDEMVAKLKTLNETVRKNLARMAATLVEDGELDSRKKIEVLEKELGCQLTND